MGYSAAFPRFEPPTKNARGFLAIFVLTTNRKTSGAITIRGTSEFSQSTIQELNATVPFGARWNPSFVRNCLQFEGASRLDYLHAKKTRLCRQNQCQSSPPSRCGAPFSPFSREVLRARATPCFTDIRFKAVQS